MPPQRGIVRSLVSFLLIREWLRQFWICSFFLILLEKKDCQIDKYRGSIYFAKSASPSRYCFTSLEVSWPNLAEDLR